MNDKTEITIQRLVDNELDDRQRAGLLRMAESRPELWRQMALAFVEDRVWSSVVTGSQAAGFESPLTGVAGTEKQTGLRSRPWWKQYGPQILMTAAAVLFAFTIALRFNPVEHSRPARQVAGPHVPGPVDGPKGRPSGAETPGNRLVSNETWQLKVNDQVQVPLYENFAQMRQEIEKLNSGIDPTMHRRLLEAGYLVQPHIRYVTGNSQDGRSFIVPIQSYRVKRYMQ